MIVQRAIFVEVMFGRYFSHFGRVLRRFFSLLFLRPHSPSCGGGGSPGFSAFGAMPEELWRKIECSIVRLPPEFEPE